MADEPRRSGRATKGVNTKERDIDDAAAKKKGKGKGAKAKPVEEEQEEDEKEEVIRCVCGLYEEEEDVPRDMICCDICSAWQHNDCMGLPANFASDTYYCEQCRPGDHKELLAAIKRGERPWEEAARLRAIAQAEKGKKKGGKKSKKSMDREESSATPTTGQKRKAEESPASSDTKNTKRARPVAQADSNGKSASRKPSQTQLRGHPVATADAQDLPPARQGGGTSLAKLFIEQTKSAVKAGVLSLPRDTTDTAHGTRIGLHVEAALYQNLSGGTGPPNQVYKDQLRAIIFNLKKNSTLAVSVLNEEVSPDDLAAMDPKDMASEEQQAKDAAIVKEMERQHTIVEEGEQGPRIRRTHKGDEYVDEERAAPSQPAAPPVRRPTAPEVEVKSPEIKSPPHSNRRQPSVTIPRRQSSANFDINKVYSSVQSNQEGEQRFGELPPQPSRGPVNEPAGPGARADADIDALLKDEEADSEPYSPKDYPDDGAVWRGTVNGGSLGRFSTSARYAAGAKPEDKTLKTTWSDLLPNEIGINGRIQPAKADEYLCGLEFSSSSDMLVIWMTEPQDEPDLSGFTKFFSYFKTKERFGVGAQNHQPALKDIYFVPLEKGQEMPDFVKKLEGDFPSHADERGLLVPLVVKNTELPHGGVLASPSMGGSGSAAQPGQSPGMPGAMQTPITPQFMMQSPGPFNAPPTNGISHQTQPQFPHTDHAPQSQPQPQQQHFSSPPPPPYSSHNPQQYQPQPPNLPTQHSIPHAPNTPFQPTALASAHRILGPNLASSPAVVALISSAPNAGDQEMSVIRECITENPAAALDLGVLTGMLQERWGRQQQQGGGGAQGGQLGGDGGVIEGQGGGQGRGEAGSL